MPFGFSSVGVDCVILVQENLKSKLTSFLLWGNAEQNAQYKKSCMCRKVNDFNICFSLLVNQQ